MGWRSLYLTDAHYLDIGINNKRLAITKKGEKTAHFRTEDINFILIDSYNFNITGKALQELAKNHIPLVLSSSIDHMPCLQLSNPYNAHHQIGRIVTAQSKMTQKTKLEFWKRLIGYKIVSQGILIEEKKQHEIMKQQALSAKSTASLLGIEGSWAKYYWGRVVKTNTFTRTPKVYGDPNDSMNSFLNYTYAIIRARISSAIAENGMLPLFSLFHRRDYNPFALSDDLIEPYRWVADKLFSDNEDLLAEHNDMFLTSKHKKLSLTVLHQKVHIPSLKRTFSLDEAIRIGARGLRDAISAGRTQPLEDILCHKPQ
ncbi:type II CRISPR-associated endonuclease Cas1 [Sulfurimonas sp.]